MNQVFRKAVSSVFTGLKCRTVTPSIGTGLTRPNNGIAEIVSIRQIHQHERKYRYALRVRRKKENFLFPERFAKPTPRYTYLEWNYKAEIFAFGKRLGEEFDEELLREALTDQSYIHKERLKQEKLGIDPDVLNLKNNDELSEIGRDVTREVLTKFAKKEFPLLPKEGQTSIVKHLTSVKTMSEVASNLGLKDLILCEEYPPSDENFSKSFYAVIGALQKTKEDRTTKFVIDFIASMLCGKDVNEIWDISRPWNMMVELAKEKNLYPVEPRLIRQAGRNTIHAVFVVGVYDKDKQLLGQGIGETLDIAQEMAARDALKGFFNTRDPMTPFEFQSSNIPYKLVPHVRNINK